MLTSLKVVIQLNSHGTLLQPIRMRPRSMCQILQPRGKIAPKFMRMNGMMSLEVSVGLEALLLVVRRVIISDIRRIMAS